jgi:hypothetical protein
MFTIPAVLTLLPLIEDAMIRQWGDDDFARREAVTQSIKKVSQDADGIRHSPSC